MTELNNKLQLLKQKQSWIRKGLDEWLDRFAEETTEVDGEYIIICDDPDYMAVDHHYVIKPGSPEIYHIYWDQLQYKGLPDDSWKDVDQLPIEDVRLIVKSLPDALNNYSKKVAGKVNEYDSLIQSLKE